VVEGRLRLSVQVTANPNRSVVIAPRTSARVVKVLADLGDAVTAGSTLALLDSLEAAELVGELRQQESALALARAQADREKQLYAAKLRVLETAGSDPDADAARAKLERVELGRPKQEYLSALAKVELAKADHERQKLLSDSKIGAAKDLIRAEKELLSARSELQAVEETIRLGARQELLAAESALREARAQRDKVHEKLRLLGLSDAAVARAAAREHGQPALIPLVAPFRGTVIERQVTEGQLVDPASVAFKVADLATVWIVLDVYEKDLAHAAERRPVKIGVPAYPDQQFAGPITHVSDVVDEKTRAAKVRVEVPNPARILKPGMFVEASVTTPGTAKAVVVPRSAVLYLDSGPAVFVEQKEGFVPRKITLGPEAGDVVAIRDGLRDGEPVAVRGGFELKTELLKEQLGHAH
jgi:cobalt-zinc-cadmium efflux system membrane fusion protein